MIRVNLHKSLMGSEGHITLDISLQMPLQSIWAIMGPSGAGKTSILKMLAGLMKPEQGNIYVDEECWYDSKKKVWLRPQARSIGFVFQDYALFPNMNVRQNLEYALSSHSDHPLIDEVMELMQMEKLQAQKPKNLSGGQQQRVALARAIIRQPKLLLLDEPFTALDRDMRIKLQQDLLRLQDRFQTTILLVSHDAVEVARMADEVVEIHQGKVERIVKGSAILPQIVEGCFKGIVIEINHKNGYFVMQDHRIQALLRFPLEVPLSLQPKDLVEVKGDQVRILPKNDLNK